MPSPGYNSDSETVEAENSLTASSDSGRIMQSMQSRNSSAATLLRAHHVQPGMPALGDASRQIDAGQSYNVANNNNNDSNSGGDGTSSSNMSSNSSMISNNNNNMSIVFSVDPAPTSRAPLSQSSTLNGYQNHVNAPNSRPAEDPAPSTGRSRSRRRANRRIVHTQQRRLCKIHTALLRSKKYLHRTVRDLSCIRNLLRQQLQMARTLFINHQSGTYKTHT